MAHRDDHTEDDPFDDSYPGLTSAPLKPGDAGYRMGTWAPGYNPGPNWNEGVAPSPPTPRYDYNSDSPPDQAFQALTAGHGWEWQGPQAPVWDMDVNQWQRGVWGQVKGRGKGFVPDPPPGAGDPNDPNKPSDDNLPPGYIWKYINGRWTQYYTGSRPDPGKDRHGNPNTDGGGGDGGIDVTSFSGGTAPPGQYGFPSLQRPPDFSYASFDPGERFSHPDFQAPDPSDVFNEPAYQFRFREGQRSIENSRAAQGLTRTGATLKALTEYGQNFGSNEYSNVYNRAGQNYATNRSNRADIYNTNLNSRFNAWNANRGNALDTFNTNWGVTKDAFAPEQRAAEMQFGRDWDVYKFQNDDAYRWARLSSEEKQKMFELGRD